MAIIWKSDNGVCVVVVESNTAVGNMTHKPGDNVKICGWVRSIRKQKRRTFLQVAVPNVLQYGVN